VPEICIALQDERELAPSSRAVPQSTGHVQLAVVYTPVDTIWFWAVAFNAATTQTQETCSFHTQINSSQTIIMASFTKSQESIKRQQLISNLNRDILEGREALDLVRKNLFQCTLRGELNRKSELQNEETLYQQHLQKLKSRLAEEEADMQKMLSSFVASSASSSNGHLLSNTPQKGKTLPAYSVRSNVTHVYIQ
jgi:hypothetical protein